MPCPAYLVDEVESAAVAAVGEAATRWDPGRGPFVPYARTRARGAAVDFVRSWSPLSRSEWRAAVAEDEDAARVAVYQHSLSEERGDDITLGDTIQDTSAPDPHTAAEAKDAAIRALSSMSEREALTLVLTAMLDWTQEDVARILAVDPTRVCQLAASARSRVAPPAAAAEPIARIVTALAPREVDALALAARGMSAEEAGAEMGLSPWTVKSQRAAAMRKLGARNMAAAVDQGWRLGILAA